jgi:hypothetical protein
MSRSRMFFRLLSGCTLSAANFRREQGGWAQYWRSLIIHFSSERNTGFVVPVPASRSVLHPPEILQATRSSRRDTLRFARMFDR